MNYQEFNDDQAISSPCDFLFDIAYSLNDPRFYTLPNQIKCDFAGQKTSLEQRLNSSEVQTKLQTLPEQSRKIAIQIYENFSDVLKVWDVPEGPYYNYNYPFNLPPTMFNTEIAEFDKFEHIHYNEYNEVKDLSSYQIKQIFQTGTFETPSLKFPSPYIWQLSQWIVKGRQNISKSLTHDLALSYKAIHTVKYRLYNKYDFGVNFNLTVRNGLLNLIIKPFLYISILIGFREMRDYQDTSRIYNEIEEERQRKIQKFQGLCLTLYDKFHYEEGQESKEAANRTFEEFYERAVGFQAEIYGLTLQMKNTHDLHEISIQQNKNQRFLEVDEEEKMEQKQEIQKQLDDMEDFMAKYGIKFSEDENIADQIQNAISRAQEIYWRQWKHSTPEISQHLQILAYCNQVYDFEMNKLNNQICDFREQYRAQLIKDHSIRSQCQDFLDDAVNEKSKLIKPNLEKQAQQGVLNKLEKIKEVQLYAEYIEYRTHYQKLVDDAIKARKYFSSAPIIEETSTRQTFPPFEVQRINGYYSLKRTESYTVTSRYFGWKIVLMGLRWFTWTANVMFWLFVNAIIGPLGIKTLISCQPFYTNQQINSETGQVYYTDPKISPVSVLFREVCKGMKASRDDFEHQPDTGFFGKNCARICNLIEVYFFRFLIVGVIGVLMALPILILINFSLSIVLALTAWAWIPIVLVIVMLFQFLFYDFDVGYNRESLFCSPRFFPFFVNTYELIVNGILQTVLTLLLMLVFQPLFSIFMCIFGVLRYLLRSIYDCIMIMVKILYIEFVYCLGRVPASENSLAWKIAGPGISRQYFQSIGLESVIVMVAAALENCVLEEYSKRMKSKILAPSKEVQDTICTFFSMFKTNFSFSDPGCSILISCLEEAIRKRKKYPRIQTQVRFTADELSHVLRETKKFIKEQIKLKEMSEYVWAAFMVQKGDYNSLVERIMVIILGNQVLEPIESIDNLFKLNEDEGRNFSENVRRALKGQINLELPKTFRIENQLELVNKQPQKKEFVNYTQVLRDIWDSQSLSQNWSSIQMPQRCFILNRCLKNKLL